MSKLIQPNAFVIQGRGDAVLYEFPYDVWDTDLRGAKQTRITAQTINGAACALTVLDDQRKTSRILLRAGNQPGLCEITRTVSTTTEPVEKRVKSFRVLVE
jgi:hypothetical protein